MTKDKKTTEIFRKYNYEEGDENYSAFVKMQQGFSMVLDGLSDVGVIDRKDENFTETPFRVAKMYLEIFRSKKYIQDFLKQQFEKSFPTTYGGMIIEDNIHTWSVCPHHFVPIELVVNIGWIPGDDEDRKAVGISKPARLIETLAMQPLLQEDYTKEIADTLVRLLKPKGMGVIVEGRHFCMCFRGVGQKDAWTITSEMRGNFMTPDTKNEFQFLLESRKRNNH